MSRKVLIPPLATLGLLALWVGTTASTSGEDQQVAEPVYSGESEPSTFTIADSERLDSLASKHVHELAGHHELAEYIKLRKVSMWGQLPDPAAEIAHYAFMAIGQPYRRKAIMDELSEADCVTFTERCIALACTDSWAAANRLQKRLRFRDGQESLKNRNREFILDWAPNNSWLFEEITADLAAPVAEFQVQFENRTSPAVYISKEELRKAYPKLQTGDLMLVIADQSNPPSDPVVRTRCVHLAFIYKPSETGSVQILHSYPPAASQWPLARLLQNPYVRGGKFLRLRPNSRELVAAELAYLDASANLTPAELDSKLRLKKGQFGFVTPTRSPDSTLDIDGILYGVLKIRPGETLWGLFQGGWRGVVNLEVNRGFAERYPKLKATEYEGDTIHYPISWSNGDKTPF